ncbi:MAG TPA: CheR family methyltransferase [Salinivirgaceae bacterium]|nr:CheR family methyltransferase [Salinivirgaceae bacterium]HQA75755.1 CheR family methyltransferase [Salinivirgaceae bacterium]
MVSIEESNRFISAVKNVSTYNFTDYSEKSFRRRIDKILLDYKMSIDELIHKISKDSNFLEHVVQGITVNTTELFRDPELWTTLKYRILPNFKQNKSIFIWHAGCSSGQEIYSMLILLNELDLLEKAKVFATDLNTEMLEKAKKGEYRYRFNLNYLDNFDKVIKENPYNYEDIRDVPYEKYFDIDKNKDIITMKPFLRDKAVYRKHDLVNDKNIFYSKFDIIFCRNVIIYFNNKLQNQVVEMFSGNLYRDGYLILGAHESILGSVANSFERTKGIYKKKSF